MARALTAYGNGQEGWAQDSSGSWVTLMETEFSRYGNMVHSAFWAKSPKDW